MTFINQNDGFAWRSSNDGALFEGLFPDDSPTDLLEPASEDSQSVEALSPNEPDVNPDPGKIVIYVGRYDYNDMVSASKGYLKSRFDADPMGCQLHYVSGRKDALFVCLGSKLFYYLKDKTSSSLYETIKIIHAFCKKNDKAFAFTVDDVFNAFQKEIQDGTFILANVPQERRQTYARHVNQLYNNLENPNDPKSLELVAKILDLTQQMSIEASATISAIAEEASNPWRNNYLYADNSPFSFDDLQRLYKQLKASDNATEKFKNGNFKTAEELVDHVNRYFAAKNSSMRFLIHYPFLKLSMEQRKKLILLFVDADEWITSRASINSDLSDGDIVLALLYYCNQSDRLAIIKSLEADEKLYQLLSLSYFDCFNQLAYLIGNTFMEGLADKESLVSTYVEEGHGLYLNTNLFGTHNKEGFDDENKRLTFEIKTNRLLSLLDETSPIRMLIEEGTDTFPTSLTPERQYKPLDLVVIVPVADFTFDKQDFIAGETYLMPACMAYCLFKDDTKSSWLTTMNIALQIALCFTGIGGIVAAVRAGSVAAAVIGATDIAVGVGGVVVNTVPEIERNHPQFVKYYNYFTYVYTIFRVLAPSRKIFNNKKSSLGMVETNADELMEFSRLNKLNITEKNITDVLKITKRKDLCESILLSTKEVILDKKVPELIKKLKIKPVPLDRSLSNYKARLWYSYQKGGILRKIQNLSSLEKKAKTAFELRNLYRAETRRFMSDRALADYLAVAEKNMTWEQLVAKTLQKEDVRSLNDAYLRIIESSVTGRDSVDDLFKIHYK